ncbi:sugar ABC transporter substrate-binding protein [Desulfonatronovibrio hydrogenovorans]|uniref:sugar ABC transporter substrate-binding protein n=1 Tax=Desulfonatronovibrio hydrogenovorans TaxID=53245 RepID=UPI000491AE10|nr:substrate-binding domain-containing protein [Desulfonatronovibrio hydrogenovorans]
MKRIFMLILLSLLTLSLSAGISLASDSRTGQGMTIWFDTGGSPGGPYNTVVQNGAQAAARDLGVDVRFMYSDWSPEKMISNFKQAMANKPDGIVVMGHPGDDAYSPFIEQAVNEGIIVTSIDTKLKKNQEKFRTKGFGYVGTDNYLQGKALAEEALKRAQLQAGDRAFVWGLKRLQERGRRAQAILDVLEANNIVVDYFEISPEVDKDSSMGTPLVSGYLARNPDCKLMIVDHGALTSQMENFLRTAGVAPGKIFVAGFSLSPATASAIENGYVNLVSEAQPFLMGYLSVVQIVMHQRFGFTGLDIDTGGGMIDNHNIKVIAPLAKEGIR